MPSLLVFAAEAAGPEDALRRTRWIADRTVEKLQGDGYDVATLLDQDATREKLEEELDEKDTAGVAFFSHGRRSSTPALGNDCVVGSDAHPAFDRGNLEIMKGRWGHAVACRLGEELASAAVNAGAECFAGYRSALHVEWAPEEIPGELTETVTALVVSTTRLLAKGERDESTLRAAVRRSADEVLLWLDEHEDAPSHLGLFAEQLAGVVVLSAPDQKKCRAR